MKSNSQPNEQTIDTAPRDGTEIEVLENGEWQPVVWSNERHCILGSRAGSYPPGWATGPACDTDLNLPLDINPTHWRPLVTEKPDTQRDVMLDLLASLTAAVSLLKRGSKKCAPSDKMFDQMIADYEGSIERGRVELQKK